MRSMQPSPPKSHVAEPQQLKCCFYLGDLRTPIAIDNNWVFAINKCPKRLHSLIGEEAAFADRKKRQNSRMSIRCRPMRLGDVAVCVQIIATTSMQRNPASLQRWGRMTQSAST